MRNLSYENEFDLHENEPVGGTHFHMNGFALRLVLKRRQKGLENGLLQKEIFYTTSFVFFIAEVITLRALSWRKTAP